jgi:hypothetical protein
MQRELVFYNLFVAQGVVAEIFINDLPLYETLVRGQVGANGPINELLVPGENEVSIRLLRDIDRDYQHYYFRFYVFKVIGGTAEQPEIDILHDVRFPQRFEEADAVRKKAPFHHLGRFDPRIETHMPPHLSLPSLDVPDEGTPSLRDAVAALHESLAAGDLDRYLDLSALNIALRDDAYAGTAEHSAGAQRKVFADFFSRPLEVAPLDPAELHFEARAGGRVVYVRRVDGRPVLAARQKDDPTELLTARLTFIAQDGRWQRYC